MVKELFKSELSQLEDIRQKIREGIATVNDYELYESLLKKAGIEEHEIKETMYKYGYENYKSYVEALKIASTYEQKRILKAIIGASLAALVLYVIYLIAIGEVKQKD
jgi:hypothetical protein